MRPGLRFHDGQPVTTADVIPSMQRWLRLAQPTLRDITGPWSPTIPGRSPGPCVEKLGAAFTSAAPEARPAVLAALQAGLPDAAPYAVLGQAEQFVAHRREVSGVLSSPVIAY